MTNLKLTNLLFPTALFKKYEEMVKKDTLFDKQKKTRKKKAK